MGVFTEIGLKLKIFLIAQLFFWVILGAFYNQRDNLQEALLPILPDFMLYWQLNEFLPMIWGVLVTSLIFMSVAAVWRIHVIRVFQKRDSLRQQDADLVFPKGLYIDEGMAKQLADSGYVAQSENPKGGEN